MEQPPLFDLPAPRVLSAVQLLESLLFIAGEALTVAQLAQALELPADAVEAAIETLAAACAERGVRVQRHGDQVQLVSAPEASAVIERFLGVQPQAKLSAAALETLAIIAYRQPITRAQVDALRGVDSSGVIRALLGRDLVTEAGRLETVGRPIVYSTTDEFLRQFGLTRLDDLPPIELPEVVQLTPLVEPK
ncbi:MAG: SMC-Scp complex subunit ScpB [Chloroflexi bacterium SZAS-1]|jgi:segregation and condensation protein B|nr:SMC-Scp complex subunit ScpB [Chloroflexi bacterium SZAS-1]HNP86137.1 SMC-Scp complex subunit ScpB [Kouleothrix sp.]